MQYTIKQLRKIIEDGRTHWLRAYHIMEEYEFVLENNNPVFDQMPNIKKTMKEDVVHLRLKLKLAAERSRKNLNAIEKFLDEDEAVNGWMGEDRVIEI